MREFRGEVPKVSFIHPRLASHRLHLLPLYCHSLQPSYCACLRPPELPPRLSGGKRTHTHTGVSEKHLQPLPPCQEGQASVQSCPPLSPERADEEVTGRSGLGDPALKVQLASIQGDSLRGGQGS